jgi:hypothetical protein
MVDNRDKFVSELLELLEMSSNNTSSKTHYLQGTNIPNTEMIGKDRSLLKQHDVLKIANVKRITRKKTHDGKQ